MLQHAALNERRNDEGEVILTGGWIHDAKPQNGFALVFRWHDKTLPTLKQLLTPLGVGAGIPAAALKNDD